MRNGVDSRRYFRNICRKNLKSYMTNNLISGGVNMYYRSTLVYKLSKRIHLRKSFRKEIMKTTKDKFSSGTISQAIFLKKLSIKLIRIQKIKKILDL